VQTANSDAVAPLTNANVFFSRTDKSPSQSVALTGASRKVTVVSGATSLRTPRGAGRECKCDITPIPSHEPSHASNQHHLAARPSRKAHPTTKIPSRVATVMKTSGLVNACRK